MIQLSVITVVKDDFYGLKLTRESLLPVTGVTLQWIIVDGTPDMAQVTEISRHCPFNVLVISEKDKSPYEAMNKGMRKATGNWVLFLNAGDRIIWSKKLSGYLHRSEHPDIYLGNTNYSYKRVIKKKKVSKKYSWSFGMPACHQSVFFSNSGSFDLYYNTNYKYAADYEMLLRNTSNGATVEVIDVAVSLVNPYGMSNRNQFAVTKEHFHIAGAYKRIGKRQACIYLWKFIVVLIADLYNRYFRKRK